MRRARGPRRVDGLWALGAVQPEANQAQGLVGLAASGPRVEPEAPLPGLSEVCSPSRGDSATALPIMVDIETELGK